MSLSVKMRSVSSNSVFKQVWLLVILNMLVVSVVGDCPEQLQELCLECDINNKCIDCKLGYYVSDGICLKCSNECLDCNDGETCITCATGYVLINEVCAPCDKYCIQCEIDPHYCTECKADFKLDADNTCHYRYTLILIITAALLVTCVLGTIFVIVKRCCGNAAAKPENYGIVLDDETRSHMKTVLTHKIDIGKTNENLDLSAVRPSIYQASGGSTSKSFFDPQNDSVDTQGLLLNMQPDSQPKPTSLRLK